MSNLSWIQSLIDILNSAAVAQLATKFVSMWSERKFRGVYRVHELQVQLELKDKHGRKAVYAKHQSVTFLQNDVFAIQDQAWGDGEIFTDYKCSPGKAVDYYEEGFRKRVLISLRGVRNKGDTETFTIERTITDGFTQSISYFQVQIDHPTECMEFSLIFPSSRLPKEIVLIEENTKRSYKPTYDQRIQLADGRRQFQWHVKHPRIYSGYIVQWEW